MPNQPAPDKEVLSFKVNRALKARIVKLSKRRGETMSETIVSILTHATQDVQLSAEEYQEIAQAVARASHHQPARSKGSRDEAAEGGTN
jgi:macrodomain Ter protein organizer (MatP/YcbG family)